MRFLSFVPMLLLAACGGGNRTDAAAPPAAAPASSIAPVASVDAGAATPAAADIPDANVRPRALVLAPRYAWTDAAVDVANVTTALVQAGIAFDLPAKGSDWASVDKLDEYALAVVPGYLLGSVVDRVREKLEAFVSKGGVLVVFKPIPEPGKPAAVTLAGLTSGERHRDVEELRFEGSSSATSFVDSEEEKTFGINPKGEKNGLEVWTYVTAEGTEVLAKGFRAGAAAGAVVTRRKLGKGAVYAIGHDLASFGATRCYLNCFEPAGDVMRLVLDGALRESSLGHTAIFATAPSLASSVVVLTHDINTHEGLFSGKWGEPGALQLAKVEKERGVHGTFFVFADQRGGEWNAKTIKELCALDMCPAGIQGVLRTQQFARLPGGMVRDTPTSPWRCKETLSTYGSPSLCGEIFLSAQLLQNAGSKPPRAWRSPSLAYHAQLIDMIASAGVQIDSSFGVGDFPYNVPLDMATTGIQQRRFHRRPVLELPLTLDDGIDVTTEGKRERTELTHDTAAKLRSIWEQVILENRKNRGYTTVRISPHPADAIEAKGAFLGALLDDFARQHPDVVFRSQQEVADFWRAREDAKLDARFDSKTGYAGTLTIGKTSAPGLTIELGDAVKSFECSKCGETKIVGHRVALVSALPPGTKAEWTAKIR